MCPSIFAISSAVASLAPPSPRPRPACGSPAGPHQPAASAPYPRRYRQRPARMHPYHRSGARSPLRPQSSAGAGVHGRRDSDAGGRLIIDVVSARGRQSAARGPAIRSKRGSRREPDLDGGSRPCAPGCLRPSRDSRRPPAGPEPNEHSRGPGAHGPSALRPPGLGRVGRAAGRPRGAG